MVDSDKRNCKCYKSNGRYFISEMPENDIIRETHTYYYVYVHIGMYTSNGVLYVSTDSTMARLV